MTDTEKLPLSSLRYVIFNVMTGELEEKAVLTQDGKIAFWNESGGWQETDDNYYIVLMGNDQEEIMRTAKLLKENYCIGGVQ